MFTEKLFNQFGDNPAVILPDGKFFKYSDVNIHISSIKSYLDKKSLVICLLNNNIGSFLGYISFLSSESVPILLSELIDINSLINLIEIYRPRYLWIPKKLEINVNQILY